MYTHDKRKDNKMDITQITNLISSCGFPIVAFLIMVYMLKYFYDMNLNVINNSIDGLKQSIEELKDLLLTMKGGK